MDQNDKNGQKNKVGTSKQNDQGQKEWENFSDEIINKLSNLPANTKKKPKSRSISFKINPLIMIITVVLLVLLSFSVFGRVDTTQKVTLDELVKGIKGNRYSQLLIQDDGKVQGVGKSYVTLDAANSNLKISTSADYKLSDSKNGDFTVETLDQLITSLKGQDLFSQFKSLFNQSANSLKEIVIGSDFIIGINSLNQKDILVRGVSESDFQQKLDDEGITVQSLQIPVKKLRTYAATIDQQSFVEKENNVQYSNIFILDGEVIARIKPDFVTQVYIDWTPSIYSFTDILQKEGVSLSTSTFEIVSTNVPQAISFGDIISIVTLVGFVVLVFFLFRGAQSSGMGIMQFGQSKAKVFWGTKPDTTFDDVAGIDEARDELNEIVDFLKNPNKYRKLGARIPKGVLMVGPPGTGKTLLARAIAGEARVPFFHTSGSEFEEMLVGAGASRVRDLFAKAKKAAPALVFIDEIDAVARKRGTKIQTGATEQTLNQILVEMDGFEKNVNVIVLAATNRPDVLDPAILRPGRFDRQIRIEVPDMQGRKEILMVHAKNKIFAKDIDFEKIAKRTVGFTGADLENILNESAILAARLGQKEISMEDIEESVSKVVLGPAKKSRKRAEAEVKLVAYHEAGHAVVSRYTPNATPVDKISIVSRGSSGGVTMFLPEKDEYIISKSKLIADITVSLGGRAAEEVALDDVSTGASNDIEKATAVARRMIQKFGMSEKLGLVQYGDFEEDEYLGYAYAGSKEYSEKTAEQIDEEVRTMVDKAYTNAKKILVEHRDKLDAVAKLLLEKEVLSKDEFEKVF